MRILYICADFGIPVRGFKGASVHVREVSEALMRRGHAVALLTPNVGEGNEITAELEDVPAPPLPPGAEAVLRALGTPLGRGKQLAREVRELAYNRVLARAATAFAARWRPDGIYERYALFGLAGGALAARLGVPHLVEVNAPLRIERQHAAGLALEWPARWCERRIFGRAQRIFCVSQAMEDFVRARGARADRVLVQPNGVAVERFHPENRALELRARLGFTAGDVVAGFVGSLKPWHGVEDLVRAVALARQAAPRLRLLIVGDGPARAAIEQAIANSGLRDVTTLAGKVPHAAIPEYLAAMDIAVAPYLAATNFYYSPLKIFEYMAAGRTVIASRLGQIPEMVEDGVAGLLFEPGNVAALAAHLRAAATQPDLCRALGARGVALAHERHTWSTVAERIETIFQEERARMGSGRA